MSEICVKYDSTNMNRRLAYATRRSWKLLNFFSLLFFLWELFSVKINGWFIGGFLKIRHMKNASHNFTDLIETRTYFTSMFLKHLFENGFNFGGRCWCLRCWKMFSLTLDIIRETMDYRYLEIERLEQHFLLNTVVESWSKILVFVVLLRSFYLYLRRWNQVWNR